MTSWFDQGRTSLYLVVTLKYIYALRFYFALRVNSSCLQHPSRLSQFTFSIAVDCVNVGTAMDVDKEMNGKVCSTDLCVCVDLYASVHRSIKFVELIDQFSSDLSLILFT